jgi:hypothetical protein
MELEFWVSFLGERGTWHLFLTLWLRNKVLSEYSANTVYTSK